MADALILEARKKYHQSLIENKVLSITETGVASNADSNNTPSQERAKLVAEKLGARICSKLKGQTPTQGGFSTIQLSERPTFSFGLYVSF